MLKKNRSKFVRKLVLCLQNLDWTKMPNFFFLSQIPFFKANFFKKLKKASCLLLERRTTFYALKFQVLTIPRSLIQAKYSRQFETLKCGIATGRKARKIAFPCGWTHFRLISRGLFYAIDMLTERDLFRQHIIGVIEPHFYATLKHSYRKAKCILISYQGFLPYWHWADGRQIIFSGFNTRQ